MDNKKQTPEQLQTDWERATERAAAESSRTQDLGDMLTDSAGLYIKSGVEAGGLWGTTSCTCQQTCTQNAVCSA